MSKFQRATLILSFGLLLTCPSAQIFGQAFTQLQQFLAREGGLTQHEISLLGNGQPMAKALQARTPDEIVILGVIYIKADPARYVGYAQDIDRLRGTPGYQAIKRFSTPPTLTDLQGFEFDPADVQALKRCTAGNCAIQLPGAAIESLHKTINWSSPNLNDEVNQAIQKLALSELQQYQQQGDHMLGAVYNDKRQPVSMTAQFQYILSYAREFSSNYPAFYGYLTSYPQSKPANVDTYFYWDKVSFGLKPTLRIIQVFTMTGLSPKDPAYITAEKQLYSSHYFETALDVTLCVRSTGDQSGFYLVQVMGSEQDGLTGFEGSILRRAAVSHSVADEQASLIAIKRTLEQH
jgi:hypothetical protein